MTSPTPVPRAWQRMLSGRRLDLLTPSPDDIEIEDIAHGLARVARWNGQTTGAHAFSVAQHSMIVTRIVEAKNPRFGSLELSAALLHDAPEYVIGDLISPFKAAIGLDYKAFETRLLNAIYLRFGIPETVANAVKVEIKRADHIAAFYEATRLAGFGTAEAEDFFGKPDILSDLENELDHLEPWPAETVQQRFLERFAQLALP
jgi:uncharacterized protein